MITTEIDKYKIRLSFSKAALRYDIFASFQKQTARELVNKLSTISCQPSAMKILDVGCGTGFLTYGMADALPEANIFGCDISHAMIKVASCKLQAARDKKMRFLTADGGVLPYKDGIFDRVASNLTYQWIHDIKTAFLEAYRVLRPSGVFIFSVLGPETLKELRHCYIEAKARFNRNGLPPFIVFLDKQMLQSALENAGFKNISIKKTNIIKAYPDMWALLKAMKSIGAGNPFKEGDKSLARGSLLKQMAEVYKEKFKGQKSKVKTFTDHWPLTTEHCIYATYEVMFVYGEK
ncbi:MAG: methyltransferase domain-containing protein [Deltaproteobacteria bacterium]